MNQTDKRIKAAFDAVKMPAHLKAATLASIEAQRTNAEATDATFTPTAPADTEAAAIDHGVPPEFIAIPGSKNPGTSLGPKSQRPASRKHRFSGMGQRIGLAVAACLCLLMIGVGGYTVYDTETAYIDIDVNPSVELGVNCFDIVVSTRAYNEDGQRALDHASLTGKRYEEALQLLLQSEEAIGYIGEDSFVAVNIASGNQGQVTNLEGSSATCIQRTPVQNYSCSQMTKAEHLAAQDKGMGMGKYRAYLILHDLDPAITPEECSLMSMRELRDRIAALGGTTENLGQGQGQGSAQGNANGQGQGSGQGQGQGQGNANANGQGPGSGQGNGQAAAVDTEGGSAGQGKGQGGSNGQGNGQGRGNGQGNGGQRGNGQNQ
ncbi:MAG: hypothetical protein RR655_01720 [Raoultibacter sp.]